ncbi:hypothetical protein BDY24DRAFT_395139 [Mrakia frigida]|uniref:uncharacterized protein n=1 Tax=Mrakia frigida TaxID=29902 RepID=UPI003FCC2208
MVASSSRPMGRSLSGSTNGSGGGQASAPGSVSSAAQPFSPFEAAFGADPSSSSTTKRRRTESPVVGTAPPPPTTYALPAVQPTPAPPPGPKQYALPAVYPPKPKAHEPFVLPSRPPPPPPPASKPRTVLPAFLPPPPPPAPERPAFRIPPFIPAPAPPRIPAVDSIPTPVATSSLAASSSSTGGGTGPSHQALSPSVLQPPPMPAMTPFQTHDRQKEAHHAMGGFSFHSEGLGGGGVGAGKQVEPPREKV